MTKVLSSHLVRATLGRPFANIYHVAWLSLRHPQPDDVFISPVQRSAAGIRRHRKSAVRLVSPTNYTMFAFRRHIYVCPLYPEKLVFNIVVEHSRKRNSEAGIYIMVGVLVRTALQMGYRRSVPLAVQVIHPVIIPNRSFQRSISVPRGLPLRRRASLSRLVLRRPNGCPVLSNKLSIHDLWSDYLTPRSKGIFTTGR